MAATITAHTIVRNDERFVGFAIRSVIQHVDRLIVFDTGSTDGTVAVVRALEREYPGKILLEEKGDADMQRHTQLRQEMLERTTTDWFMILDGDEIWTREGMVEAREVIGKSSQITCIASPYYNCVGDIFHDYVRQDTFQILGYRGRCAPRFFRITPGLHWKGAYNEDILVNAADGVAFNESNSFILRARFWHMTHMERSSTDATVYSSGGSRSDKRRPTWFGIGRRIPDPVPEVFDPAYQDAHRMGAVRSFFNFLTFAASRAGREVARRARATS